MSEEILKSLFEAAVASADPADVVAGNLPPPPTGRTLVVGFGKAAAAMARAVENHWPGPLSGLVVTAYGCGAPCERIEVVEAGHPVPDAAGMEAARRILKSVGGLSENDLVVCLVSGGGSALLTLPGPGLSLADKQAVNEKLILSGASISEINCVRKHLSAIKGGRLARAAFPARLAALAISDVPGDDLSVIASGPTVADPTTYAEARGVLEKYSISPPGAVSECLARAADETPKPGDQTLARAGTVLVAAPAGALRAAAAAAQAAGLNPIILGDAIEGESAAVAAAQARAALGAEPGSVLISGGETTVKVRGKGRGGPNGEFMLALAVALDGHPGISAIACDTDGLDGSGGAAGAVIGPTTMDRARGLGLDAVGMLTDNDSYGFFSALGDLVICGPTRTNVNDFRAILIESAR
ncbi:MAG: glycerate kinase [Rhodospirillales bacterium]